MTVSPDPRPTRGFPNEGFTMFLDVHGIELRVDDHHPLPLKLGWDLLDQLRREAQTPRVSGQDGAAGGSS